MNVTPVWLKQQHENDPWGMKGYEWCCQLLDQEFCVVSQLMFQYQKSWFELNKYDRNVKCHISIRYPKTPAKTDEINQRVMNRRDRKNVWTVDPSFYMKQASKPTTLLLHLCCFIRRIQSTRNSKWRTMHDIHGKYIMLSSNISCFKRGRILQLHPETQWGRKRSWLRLSSSHLLSWRVSLTWWKRIAVSFIIIGWLCCFLLSFPFGYSERRNIFDLNHGERDNEREIFLADVSFTS